jgi:putative tryptophan/tyrosine transport system substrate-binding protein
MMKRREFITFLGGAAATWPLAARAQQAGKLPTIGFLGAGSPSYWSSYVSALVHRLRELGWIEGRTVTIEYRWGEGRAERFTEIAAEFVRLKVDVILAAIPHRSLVLRTESATGAADVHVRFSVDLVKYISICEGG